MFSKLNAFLTIPEHLRQSYKDSVARCIQARLRVFTVTVFCLFLVAILSHMVIDPSVPLIERAKTLGILTVGVGLVLYFTRCIACINTAKLTAFLFTGLILFLLTYGPMNRPEAFSYAPHMLSLVFASLMFPWFIRDVFVISGIHFAGWLIYYYTRDMTSVEIPPTAFGADPFVNGNVFMIFTALLCLLIRYKDNQRDIHNFVLLKDVQAKKNQMEKELELASRIQDTLVPQSFDSPRAEVFVSYKPVASIGGDYANFQMIDENRLTFFIGDVTGHGVPAALMVNRLHSEFDRLAATGKRPGEILSDLNDFVIRTFNGTSMYLTAFCGMIDFEEERIHYSNYGHPPQYICRLKDSSVKALSAQTSLLGLDLDQGKAVYESYIDYEEGDRIFLFTDGILELKNNGGEEFGPGRLQQFIRENASTSGPETHERLMQRLLSFGSNGFKDDVFIISIQCKAHLHKQASTLSQVTGAE